MHAEMFSIISIAVGLLCLIMVALLFHKIGALGSKLALQTAVISKMQNSLKSRAATNAVAENAEIIFQGLLQNLIPITRALEINPRQSGEHPLWQTIGGILDEYAKNPFVLENLRRQIKLNPETARNLDDYLSRADKFLQHLSQTESSGILTQTFMDGLLGQSVTFFAQARRSAQDS
jgi:hypothetical protein